MTRKIQEGDESIPSLMITWLKFGFGWWKLVKAWSFNGVGGEEEKKMEWLKGEGEEVEFLKVKERKKSDFAFNRVVGFFRL